MIEHFNNINKTKINLNWKDNEINNYILRSKLKDKLLKINLVLCIKHRSEKIKTDKMNKIDEKFLESLNETEKKFKILQNYSEIISQIINEFIKKDLDVIKPNNGKEIVSINLSYLYNIKIRSIEEINYMELDKMFPRTKDEETRKKIIKNSIIISTLSRDSEIIFFISNKNNEETEISKSIKYTQGYKICLPPKIIKDLSFLRYTSKTYKEEPVKINESKEIKTEDFLKNKNIWIKPFRRALGEPEEKKYEDFMEKKINPSLIINYLNKLNDTELSINIDLLNSINKLANVKGNNSWKLISRNRLIDNIYIIDKIECSVILDDDEYSNVKLDSIIQDAATYELIKKQAEDIIKFNNNSFYLEYKLDHRYRVYPVSWPLNYQLNHIARAITQIKTKVNKEKIINNFIEKFKRWNLTEKEIFPFYTRLEDSRKKIDKLTKNDMNKEAISQLLISLSEEKTNNEEIKIIESLNIIKELRYLNLEKFSKNLKEKKWDNKKVLKLLTILNVLKLIEKGKEEEAFNSTVWLDASSNSLQIVAYRLGVKNEFMLKLLNIYDNDTNYKGIYDFVHENISKPSKKEEIVKLYENLPKINLEKIHSRSDAKRRLMPSPYGKTLFTCIKEDRKELLKYEDNQWNSLKFEEKTKISTYLWKRSLDILKEQGLDIEEYKKLFTEKTKRYWENNVNLPVVINNSSSSERKKLRENFGNYELLGEKLYEEIGEEDRKKFDEIENEIIEKINLNKTKKKNIEDKEITKKIKENLKENYENKELFKIIKNFEKKFETVKKISLDEKEFNIRRKIKIKEKEYTLRMIKNIQKFDKEAVKRSLMPSSVHSWDACVLIKVKKVCEELGIQINTIHDSIGCQLWTVPIVRMIFIITNIEMINESQKKEIYPYETKKKNKIKKRRMLGSRNIFKL